MSERIPTLEEQLATVDDLLVQYEEGGISASDLIEALVSARIAGLHADFGRRYEDLFGNQDRTDIPDAL